MKLLNEKRTLLTKLISIQAHENSGGAAGGSGGGGIAPFSVSSSRYQGNRIVGKQFDGYSVQSDNMSSITGASYATFGPRGDAPQRQAQPVPHFVPKLRLPGGGHR